MRETGPKIDRADADAAAIARGYEARAINARAIVALFAGFAVLFAVLCGGLWRLKRTYDRRPETAAGSRSVATLPPASAAAPPLQPQVGHPALDNWDLTAMRAAEDKTFDALGWQRDDRTHRYVVPAAVLARLQQRRPATRPQDGGR